MDETLFAFVKHNSYNDSMSLALFDEGYPYVVPLNFGFSEKTGEINLYFHGADTGKKIALIRKNPHVAFTMHCNHVLIEGGKAVIIL